MMAFSSLADGKLSRLFEAFDFLVRGGGLSFGWRKEADDRSRSEEEARRDVWKRDAWGLEG